MSTNLARRWKSGPTAPTRCRDSLGGAVNGTLNLTFLRDPGSAMEDVEADLQAIFDDDGLITVVIHDDRDRARHAGDNVPFWMRLPPTRSTRAGL